MLIISCPRCDEKVLAPAGASPTAQVQCPLCSAEYTLSEAMQDLPPALVLLDPPAPALELDPAEDADTATGLASFGLEDTDEFEAAEEGDFTTAGDPNVTEEPSFTFEDDDKGTDLGDEFSIDGGEEEEFKMGEPEEISPQATAFDFGGGGGTATATKSISTTPTRSTKKKKKKSPVVLIVEVMLGGLFAVVFVIFFLWWFPWWIQDSQRDPFGLAQIPYLGMAAPERLRGPAPAGGNGEEVEGPHNGAGVHLPPEESGFGEFDDKFSQPGDAGLDDSGMLDDHGHSHDDGFDHEDEIVGTDPLRGNFGEDDFGLDSPTGGEEGIGFPGIDPLENDPLADDPLEEELAGGGLTEEENGGIELDPLDNPLLDEPEDELALNDDEMIEGGDEGVVEEPAATASIPEFVQAASPAELETAIAEAESAIDARMHADEAPATERGDIARNYYTALSRLAEALGGVAPGQAISNGSTDNASEILARVGNSPVEFEFFGKVASGWMSPSVRRNNGVVLAGQVITIEPAGSYYATQLQLSGGSGKIVEVLTAGDPTAMIEGGYQEGARVVIAGTVIDEPATTVPDYTGSAPQIVWTSTAVEVPAGE